jgi:hypothetical protein
VYRRAGNNCEERSLNRAIQSEAVSFTIKCARGAPEDWNPAEVDKYMKDLPENAGDDRLIFDLWASMFYFPAVSVAAELGIFEALSKIPSNGSDLADRLGYNRRGLGILLPLLASLGLLRHHGGVYRLVPAARTYLLRDSPYSWKALLTATQRDMPFQLQIRAGVTGQAVAKEAIAGEPERPGDVWGSGQVSIERARAMGSALHAQSMLPAESVANYGDFDGITKILDVAGGVGTFSIALARAYPSLHFTVIDLPAVCQILKEYATKAGVSDRVEGYAVDIFREPWPLGHDAVLLSNVLHDWDDSNCALLVRRAFECLPSGGRIYLHEMLLDDSGSGPLATAAFAVAMLVYNDGRQFRFAELESWLSGAGFRDIEVTETHAYYSLIRARKP